MLIIPILLVMLLLALLVKRYVVPFIIFDLNESQMFAGDFDSILPILQTEYHFWQVFVLCLAFALLIGLPLEVKFSKIRSMYYQQAQLFTRANSIEINELLAIAKARNGYVTVADLVAQSETFTMSRASKILDRLQKQGIIDLSISPSGEMLYYFPGFDQSKTPK